MIRIGDFEIRSVVTGRLRLDGGATVPFGGKHPEASPIDLWAGCFSFSWRAER